MCESPITTMITEVQDNIAKQFAEQTENMIYQEVHNVGIYVDKEELIKALAYDRNQYEKGYHDAMSVLKDIKAEIKVEYDREAQNHDSFDEYSEGRYDAFGFCLRSIDKHIESKV